MNLYEQTQAFSAELLANERRAASVMVRSYLTAYSAINTEIGVVQRKIAAARAAGVDVSPAWLYQQGRLGVLQAQVLAQITKFGERADIILGGSIESATSLGAAHANALLSTALPPGVAISPSMPPVRVGGKATSAAASKFVPVIADEVSLATGAIEKLAGATQPEAAVGRLLAQLGPDAAQAVTRALTQGLALGQNPRVIANGMRDALGGNLTRALTIARTETLRAYREASRETYTRNSSLLDGWTWISALGKRTCASCFAQHGSVHPLTDVMATHPNCFPAGTIVSGPRAHASTERWYEGELVDLVTERGRRLSVTPNHPLLTPRGWVAAGLIEEGDDLIGSRLGERMAATIDPDDEQVPTPIEQVARSLGGTGRMAAGTVPTATEDFHGDGIDGEVCVVRTDRLLRDRLYSSIPQPSIEDAFGGRHMGLPLLAGQGNLGAVLKRLRLTADRCVGCGRIPEILIGGAGFGHEAVGLGVPTYGHLAVTEGTADRGAGYAEALGNCILGLACEVATDDLIHGDLLAGSLSHLPADDRLPRCEVTEQPAGLQPIGESALADAEDGRRILDALAGQVCGDRVLQVSRRTFRGHVLNLETSEGWYSANGIVAHNCRCSMAPATKSWRELGFGDTPEGVKIEKGPDIFRKLPVDEQRATLGPGKLDALKRGKITLSDLVARKDSPVWGPGTSEASLAAARRNAAARRAGKVTKTERVHGLQSLAEAEAVGIRKGWSCGSPCRIVEFRPATMADRKALTIPPAWTDVRVAVDPKSPLIATGRDAKGRLQSRYSQAHTEAASLKKFERGAAFSSSLESDILPAIRRDSLSGPNVEEAAVLQVIHMTGFRVGSRADTGARVQAYGASTLRAEHVTITGNRVAFDFIGKEGVRQQHTITDAALAQMLAPRVALGGDLFRTTGGKINTYINRVSGTETRFSVKDFRTWVAGETALRAISATNVPTTAAEFLRARMAVAKLVSTKLGNRPAQALSSYIDPRLFSSWGQF